MPDVELKIKANTIEVTPYDLTTEEGKDLEFSAGGLPFKIVFHDKTPSPLDAAVSHQAKKAKVRHGTGGNKQYRYAVAIYSPQKDELFLLPDCPSIIVH